MPASTVVRLDELRVRREQRLQRCFALHRTDGERFRVVHHLAEAARLLAADRVAAVWIDEYGPGVVHPDTVLDLLSDIPRRRFAAEPLRLAWNDGVPGKIDLPDLGRSGLISIHDATRSLCAVALGSDGSRAWFLIVEGLGARLPLDGETSGRLMFLAGECAGVLLHRDLPAGGRARARPRFAGWPVLRDTEGRENEEATSRRIGSRFLVARLLRATVDDDFAIDPKSTKSTSSASPRSPGWTARGPPRPSLPSERRLPRWPRGIPSPRSRRDPRGDRSALEGAGSRLAQLSPPGSTGGGGFGLPRTAAESRASGPVGETEQAETARATNRSERSRRAFFIVRSSVVWGGDPRGGGRTPPKSRLAPRGPLAGGARAHRGERVTAARVLERCRPGGPSSGTRAPRPAR